jgi:hypothetical protein
MTPTHDNLRQSPRRSRRWRRHVPVSIVGAVLLLSCPGCINVSAMMSKMILGDPQVDASFKSRTGVKLSDEHTVIVYVTAPTSVLDVHPSLSLDLQKQIAQRMELRKINVINPNDVSRAVEDKGSSPSPALIARLFPQADYILHVGVGAFDCREPNSPNLYHGYATGMIQGYAVRGGDPEGPRLPSEIFQQEFQIEYPTHPVPRDSTSLSAFEKQFLDRVSNELGRVFYDFRTSDIL